MEIKAYVCPQCGGSLEVAYDTTFTTCPHCGNKIHISYDGDAPKDPGLRQFIDGTSGVPVATALLPAEYTADAALLTQFQSDLVPMMHTLHAQNGDGSVRFVSASAEMFTDVRSKLLQFGINASPGSFIMSSFRSLIEPEIYLLQWAYRMAGAPLKRVARATLPGHFGQNPETAAKHYLDIVQAYHAQLGEPIHIVNHHFEGMLFKYTARIEEHDCIVLAGAEYQGLEYNYGNALSDGLAGIGKSLLSGLQGLTGQRLSSPQQRQTAPPGRIPFGHAADYGQKVDAIDWGSARRFICVAWTEKEEDATEQFFRFVSSVTPDPSLAQQELQLINTRLSQQMQHVQMQRMQAQQMQMQTIRMQGDLSRHIAQNNAQVSAGIMDSWNRRQAAQTRMSTGFSQAVRGVNTYTTPSGGTVEATAAADHVYQNKFGDTIGISGNDIDQGLASKLNWTKLDPQ
ncbi:MAG: TFIIB-type zinc ribbon-containing protein [Lachnospiraceae bacterium]|nr:TFIIB-type zinc ribbon-containing protein [Lachnospiraceae bacterium]